jgi:hypothetical protein
MKPIFLVLVGIIGLFSLHKEKLIKSSFLTNLTIHSFVFLFLLQFYFEWNLELSPFIYLLGLFLFYKIIKVFLFDNENSNKPIPMISVICILIGIEILLFALSKKYNFLNFHPNESIFPF